MSFSRCNTNRQGQKESVIPYSSDALRWDIFRVREAWRELRRQHDRFSIFGYLAAVYHLVAVWKVENQAIERTTTSIATKKAGLWKHYRAVCGSHQLHQLAKGCRWKSAE